MLLYNHSMNGFYYYYYYYSVGNTRNKHSLTVKLNMLVVANSVLRSFTEKLVNDGFLIKNFIEIKTLSFHCNTIL